jgi:RNA polymerase sigma-B factor
VSEIRPRSLLASLAPQKPGALLKRVSTKRGVHRSRKIEGLSRVSVAWTVTDRRPSEEAGGPPPRNHERLLEERRLLDAYHLHGDLEAREKLVERFQPLVRRLVRRFERSGEPIEDLMQVANLGLVKAVDRFEPERGAAFSSFAVPTVIGELKRYFRDSGWAVHVPRVLQERVLEVNRVLTELARELQRSPTLHELAAATGLEQEEVLEAMEAGMAYDSLSLEAPASTTEEGSEPMAERISVEEQGYELAEYYATIAPQLRSLEERDRLVLHLRFVEDLTQSEIAKRIGVSQMHVSRLIRAALERLRRRIGD